MIFELKNNNYIKVNQQSEIGYNRTYINFTVIQKNGNWKHNEEITIKNSMYNNVEDYLQSNYKLK